MRAILASMAFILAGLAAAQADDDPRPLVVVELFTSQGCSSCPPADRLLRELTSREDVLPLALHVDYWDYIGWKDTFARREHTKRQKAYAHASGARSVFTPQMIVGGTTTVVGYRPMQVVDAIHLHRDRIGPVALAAELRGEELTISARLRDGVAPGKRLSVHLVRYLPSATVAIKRGENAGHALEYSNIVVAWDRIGEWDMARPFTATVPFSGDLAGAVILQAPGPGEIWAAARVD